MEFPIAYNFWYSLCARLKFLHIFLDVMTNPTSYRTYFNSQYQEYVFEHVDWTMILSSPDGSGDINL